MTKPSAFEYYAPRTLEECLELLTEHGDEARLLSGGQSLVPLMNLRMATPEVLIDLNAIDGLSYVREEDGALVLGAMTRYADVEASPLVARHVPMLVTATAEVGYPAIRNRGTVGGTLAHADPVAEWPCIARALDAELVATGPAGRRTIPAADFFMGMFTTALMPDEVLTEVRFPPRGGAGGSAFHEFARKSGDYAVVAVAVDLTVADGVIEQARVAFANLADRPVRSSEAERALEGIPVAEDLDLPTTDAVKVALEQFATDDALGARGGAT
jgi:carbon-monoxide dehydrogenase medium subunit